MNPFHRTRVRSAALLVACAAAASGCSAFRSSRKLDMQPFAENTVTAMGELRRLDTPPIWIRLRPLYEHPAVLDARREAAPMRDLVKSVTWYSLQVVSLSGARIPEQQKAKELARFIEQASQRAVAKDEDSAAIAFTPARLEEILKEIASRETFMEALSSAEPIVDAVLAHGLALTENFDSSIIRAAAALEREVQGQYAGMLANRSAMLALQIRSMKALASAERIGFGDEAAAQEVCSAVPILADYLPGGKKPGAKELDKVVGSLDDQLARIKSALDQIEPQYQAYRESILELDTLRGRTNELSRLARSVLMLWARSHKNLARGIEVPPAFDIAKMIGNTAGSALDKVIPL
jgi:hypothetical protein